MGYNVYNNVAVIIISLLLHDLFPFSNLSPKCRTIFLLTPIEGKLIEIGKSAPPTISSSSTIKTSENIFPGTIAQREFLKLLSTGSLQESSFNSSKSGSLYLKLKEDIAKKKLQFNFLDHIPLFVVVNEFNELVLSLSTEAMYRINGEFDSSGSSALSPETKSLLKFNKKNILGLFFIDYDDALTFLISLKNKNPLGSPYTKYSIRTVSLAYFYELSKRYETENRSQISRSPSNLQTPQLLIIPELKSLKAILIKFKNFKGTPIYVLDLDHAIPSHHHVIYTQFYNHKTSNQASDDTNVHNVLYHSKPHNQFLIQDTKKSKLYEPAFFSLDDALETWDNFKKSNPKLKLKKNPKVIIMNLESLLNNIDLSNNKKALNLKSNLILIPKTTSSRKAQLMSQSTNLGKQILNPLIKRLNKWRTIFLLEWKQIFEV